MLSWILAVFVFALGSKAFSKTGIPLTRTKNLHGVSGKVCGVMCILLGLFLVVDGFLSFARIASQHGELVSEVQWSCEDSLQEAPIRAARFRDSG